MLKHLKWVATMIENEREETSKTVIFCETFNDIANVVSVLYEFEGQRVPLQGVYHAKTGETQKACTEEDFKGNGNQRVVLVTCALSMGVNFPFVQCVVHYSPPQTTTEIIQQPSQAGQTGQQAHSFV